ncbi:Transposase [Vibrio vulnificus]|nr:Transposase [Vibrio vulnificus]
MKYTHLTENERYMISALRKQGISTAKIAKQLGRHKATIYREIERNCRYTSSSIGTLINHGGHSKWLVTG